MRYRWPTLKLKNIPKNIEAILRTVVLELAKTTLLLDKSKVCFGQHSSGRTVWRGAPSITLQTIKKFMFNIFSVFPNITLGSLAVIRCIAR